MYIAEEERAHIQAVGRDSEGRLQYRYHPDWERGSRRDQSTQVAASRFGSPAPARCRDEGFICAGLYEA